MRGIIFVISVCAVLVGMVVRFIGGQPADSAVSHRDSATFAATGKSRGAADGRDVEVVLGGSENTLLAADIIGTLRADDARMRREVGADIARDLLSPSVAEPGGAKVHAAEALRGDAGDRPPAAAPIAGEDQNRDQAAPPPALATTSPAPAQREPVLRPMPPVAPVAHDGSAGNGKDEPADAKNADAARPVPAVVREPRPRPVTEARISEAKPAAEAKSTAVAGDKAPKPLVRPEPRPQRPPVQIASVQVRTDSAPAAKIERPTATVAMQPPAKKPALPAAAQGATKPAPATSPPASSRSSVSASSQSSAPPQSSPRVFEAQQILGRLGYNVGAPDGFDGGRTRSAVRAFQGANGLAADGTISDGLLILMRRQLKTRMQQLSEAAGGRRMLAAATSDDDSWLTTAARGLQRLLGRDFDSVRAPAEMRGYCRANPENWVYDEGRGKMVLCSTMLSSRSAGSEELAQRP